MPVHGGARSAAVRDPNVRLRGLSEIATNAAHRCSLLGVRRTLLMTGDEARRIAANIAELPELMDRPEKQSPKHVARGFLECLP